MGAALVNAERYSDMAKLIGAFGDYVDVPKMEYSHPTRF